VGRTVPRDRGDDLLTEFVAESQGHLESLDRDLASLRERPRDADAVASAFRTLHTLKGTGGCLGLARLESICHIGEGLLGRLGDDSQPAEETLSRLSATVDALRGVIASIGASSREDAGARTPPRAADTTIRVDLAAVDRLSNLVDDVSLLRNTLLQSPAIHTDAALASTMGRLIATTESLRAEVLDLRRQPLSSLWSRLPRVVSDLASFCGKRVRVETEGGDLRVDRRIIDAVKSPLIHAVRNAVDHGIEPPRERTARRKPEEGCVRIEARAADAGGLVLIVADDGAGIDPGRVRAKAVQRGLITADQAAELSDADLLPLLFVPGFSTAERVTRVSGRGIGLDAVKTHVETLGGTVSIDSRAGHGTVLTIGVPLTGRLRDDGPANVRKPRSRRSAA
jgi:two-component system chemotaxis sensor kinase CheA